MTEHIGVLVVTTATGCEVCKTLGNNGFFESLIKLEDEGFKVLYLTAEVKNVAKIFNINPGYPNFKFILKDRFDDIKESGGNYLSVINDVKFLNFIAVKYENDIKLDKQDIYKTYELETISKFCHDSYDRLTRERSASAQKEGPTARSVRSHENLYARYVKK